jgi:signal peptidase I
MDKSRLIISSSTKIARPAASFVLSLVATGLGQMYNGEIAKALALSFMRILPLIILPIAMNLKYSKSYMLVTISMVLLSAGIGIYSPFAAFMRAKRRTRIMRPYNNFFYYAIYGIIIGSCIYAAIAMLFISFRIIVIKDNSCSPIISQDDIALVRLYSPHEYRRGECILYGNNSTARIIGLNGDRISYSRSSITVNGVPLEKKRITDKKIEEFANSRRGSILAETIGNIDYPIIFEEIEKPGPDQTITVKDNYLAIAADNRISEDFIHNIKAINVIGRIEGIIYSPDRKLMLLSPFLEGLNKEMK